MPGGGWRRPLWVSVFGPSYSQRPPAPFPPGPSAAGARQGLSTRTQSCVCAGGGPGSCSQPASTRQRSRTGKRLLARRLLHAEMPALAHPSLAPYSPAGPQANAPAVEADGGTQPGCGHTRGNHTLHMLSKVFVKCSVVREKPQFNY